MVVRMVLHVVKFVNGFPRKGGPKLYSPGEIMTDRRLHADDLRLGFGSYCQVAEHVEPRNSLAPRTRAAISLGILEICQVGRYSLHWIPAIQLLGISGWSYLCPQQLL